MGTSASIDLPTLIAMEEIRQLKHRYGAYVDQAIMNPTPEHAALLASVFVEDTVLNFPGMMGRIEGREAIIRLFTEAVPKGTRLSWHSFHSPVIDISGDTARGSWTMLALVVRHAQTTPEPVKIYGRYADEFVRTDDGWKISLLHFNKESEG
ncbi:nuclear transport factor 2 family protein [Sphingomonas flavalba]|uniref:nuclear transport factor 2 family protein n=1 Tax=Sphingomonas flavalba TaxID=2559804 RepID=UPI0039DFB880